MTRRVVARAGPSPDRVRAWLEASCAAQGVPVVVTDALVLARVAALVSGTAGAAARRVSAEAGPAGRSRPPLGLHAVDVQGARSWGAGGDDDVLDQGADHSRLPVQVQRPPLSA